MDLEKQAIDILRTFASDDPYQLAYSGGKDSDVILHLAKKAQVPFKAVHNLTTVDAPETVRYVKSKKDVTIEYPSMSMWQLIVKHKTPPTRIFRYCCSELKEHSGKGKKTITGVRKAESRSRSNNQGIVTFPKPNKTIKGSVDNGDVLANRKGGVIVLNYENADTHRMVEQCYRTSKTLVNPILEWDDDYLWWYIRHEGIEINPLYKGGCSRIGCIGCPMAGKNRYREFEQYPKYKEAYIRTFDRMLEHRKQCGNKNVMGWKTGQGVFDWWMEDEKITGQYSMTFNGTDIVGYSEKIT